MTQTLDAQLVLAALKRAGCILCKTNGSASVDPLEDFTQAIKDEVNDHYAKLRDQRTKHYDDLNNIMLAVDACLKSPQWTPDEMAAISRKAVDETTGRYNIKLMPKGPRTYHSRDVLWGKDKINDELARRLIGVDFGHPDGDRRVITSTDPQTGLTSITETDRNGKVLSRDCVAVQHIMPGDAKACPHEHEEQRFEDEGGPPRRQDWDEHLKVGYGVEDHDAKEAERKALRAKINAAMGWKD